MISSVQNIIGIDSMESIISSRKILPPLHKFQRPKSEGFVAVMPNVCINLLLLCPSYNFSSKYYRYWPHGQNYGLYMKIEHYSIEKAIFRALCSK